MKLGTFNYTDMNAMNIFEANSDGEKSVELSYMLVQVSKKVGERIVSLESICGGLEGEFEQGVEIQMLLVLRWESWKLKEEEERIMNLTEQNYYPRCFYVILQFEKDFSRC